MHVDSQVRLTVLACKTIAVVLVQLAEQSDVTGSANLPDGHVLTHVCEDESPKLPTQVSTQVRVVSSAK